MYRVLIVDYDIDFTELLRKQIGSGLLVETCHDTDALLDIINSFDPDVIVIDAFFSGLNGWGVLQILIDSGRMPRVILTSRNHEPYMINRFAEMGVMNLFLKPCKISAVAACIHELCTMLECGSDGAWCVENEIDNILLRLNFQIGTNGYNAVYQAVLLRYENPDAAVTKYIYPQIAKMYGTDTRCLEKRIRDAVKAAFAGGDMNVWKLLFQSDADGVLRCPSNDVFLGRIAGGLRQRTRIKPPYKLHKQKEA